MSNETFGYPPPLDPRPLASSTGLSLAALIVGIAAFATGLVLVLGALLGAAGVVVGILAVRTRRARTQAVLGLVLSSVGLVTNLVTTAIMIIVLVASSSAHPLNRTACLVDAVPTIAIDTPCYTRDGPTIHINNQSAAATAACVTTDELWGSANGDGTLDTAAGTGDVLASLSAGAVHSPLAIADVTIVNGLPTENPAWRHPSQH
jgi:hypothetical protein